MSQPGRQLVAVGLEAALVLAPLGQQLGVDVLDRLVARGISGRVRRLAGAAQVKGPGNGLAKGEGGGRGCENGNEQEVLFHAGTITPSENRD